MRKRLCRAILAAFLAVVIGMACSSTIKTIRTSLVTVSVQSQRLAALSIEPATPWLKLKLLLARALSAQPAQAAIPAEVQSIRLTVTGSGIDPITMVQSAAGQANAVFVVEVPNGPQRHFVVEGLGSGSASLYRGDAYADLTGNPVTIAINMLSYKAPVVTSMSPAQGAAGVPVLTVLTVAFSEPMDPATVNSATFLLRDSANNSVSGSVVCSGATATFIPQASLASLATYTATITTGVRSLVGVYASQDHSWSFTTKDTLPSAVIATSPLNGIVGVPVNTVIRAVFAEPMDPATITTATFIVTDAAYLPVQGTVVYSGTTATFIPTASLAVGKLYAATITTGAKDLAGNALSSNYTWAFTTDAVPNFTGLQTIVASLSDIQLSWLPATDDVTPQNSIVYLIYQATTSQGQNYASPTFTTAPGATSYTVPIQDPGTLRYYVVRARDGAGNIDSNTSEMSPGLFVNAATGDDANQCISAAPCKTIERALQVTAGNQPIYVSEGTYSPVVTLQLKEGTALFCLGPAYSTVISRPSQLAAIAGSNGSVIDGCLLDDSAATDWFFGNLITDNGSAMTIRNCILQGMKGPQSATNVAVELSGNSTLSGSIISNFLYDGVGQAVTISGGAVVSGNTISGNDAGILVTSGSSTISGNSIVNNYGDGITVIGSSPMNPRITGNTILNNTGYGISVNGATGTAPLININSLSCNALADLYISGVDVVDAKSNAWDNDPPWVQSPVGFPCSFEVDICYIGPAPLYDGFTVVPVPCPMPPQ